MQKDSKLFDDIAKVAAGAAGELMEMKREASEMLAIKMEQFLQTKGLASKEEFETLHQMLSKIRSEQEDFKKRLEALEQGLKTAK
jgi:BMFP domain-containing protein YqiC